MAQHPMNSQPPAHHQKQRHGQRNQRHPAANHHLRHRIKQQRQSNPGETERLQHAQDQLAAVVNYDEVIEIKNIKCSETKSRRQRRFVKTVTVNQSVFSINRSQSNVHGDDQAAEKQHRFDEQQKHRAQVLTGSFHLKSTLGSFRGGLLPAIVGR
jgi:hypothetical protein